mmetsp:Transcript_18687/g.33444  ORF Transcript_18687/g.33444 Transcript_18687/m.33444 type:complete len:533 (+) Transcript_18687:41-1639(+)
MPARRRSFGRSSPLALALASACVLVTALALFAAGPPRPELQAFISRVSNRPMCAGRICRSVRTCVEPEAKDTKMPTTSSTVNKRRSTLGGLSVGLGLPVVSGFVGGVGSPEVLRSWTSASATMHLQQDEAKLVKMFENYTPSVVYITSYRSAQDQLTFERQTYPTSAGSGFVWDKDGHVVTNLHVVAEAETIEVTFMGGLATMKAKVVGVDPDTDLAVLKLVPSGLASGANMISVQAGAPTMVTPSSTSPLKGKANQEDAAVEGVKRAASAPHAPGQYLKPVEFGDSSSLKVGQSVYAIGNPFGLDHTLTRGIISGLTRDMQSPGTGRFISDVIQTDAAINPGNSGGPLLDSEGKVIGVNTALLSPSGAFAGVGLALPIDLVRSVVGQLLMEGKVQRAVLGAVLAPDRTARMLGIENGLLVLQVVPGSPAAKAGLRPTHRDEFGRPVLGDIILGANGARVAQSSDFYRVVNRLGVGDDVVLEVLRQAAREQVAVKLASSKAVEQSIMEARAFLLNREQEMEIEMPDDFQTEE